MSRERRDGPRPRPRHSQRALSLDRKEILRRMPKTKQNEYDEPQYLQLTEKQKMRQRDVTLGDAGIPPIPPCRKPTRGSKPDKNEFKVVKIVRRNPTDELGIFIAKTKLTDEGHIGYLVAHVVPGGLAEKLVKIQCIFVFVFSITIFQVSIILFQRRHSAHWGRTIERERQKTSRSYYVRS